MKQLLKKVQVLLSSGELEEALLLSKKLNPKTAIHLLFRFHANLKDLDRGCISHEDFRVERNKIASAILFANKKNLKNTL